MTIRERLRAIDRVQQSRLFKVIASGVIVALAVTVFVTYVVQVNAPATQRAQAEAEAAMEGPDPSTLDEGARLAQGAADRAREAINEILAAQGDPTAVGVAIAAGAGVALATVWLGLGLTYLALVLAVGAVAVPLAMWEPTREYGYALGGLASLVMSFTALLQAMRLAFSGSGPVFSIARTVLTEAVRLKVTLVFIFVLLVLLAALPGLLDHSQPLRYRIQSFLSFGTGLSFWVIAVLTLLFSASTVAFEQRDKIIWQTMTKPVSPWQYVLGKWLGVAGLNAVLLAVCASGVFLFTEYLRNQPAIGEVAPYVAAGYDEVSEDRLAVETQILTARVVLDVDPMDSIDDPEFLAGARAFIEERQRTNPAFGDTDDEREIVIKSLHEGMVKSFRAVGPGQVRRFNYSGLHAAKAGNHPLTFRVRVDVGSNSPDHFQQVGFAFGPMPLIPERLGAGLYHTIALTPVIVFPDSQIVRVDDANFRAARYAIETGQIAGRIYTTADIVEDDGTLSLVVVNARPGVGPSGELIPVANEETIAFPPDALGLSYAAGSYRANFARAMVVLWIKLSFLAMLAIFAATFLSFPVACLVAFGAFFAAETSGYLLTSLESFSTHSREGDLQVFNALAAYISYAVANTFRVYGELNPVGDLVQGRLITVGSVIGRGFLLSLVTALIGVFATVSMRRRELAIYSGH